MFQVVAIFSRISILQGSEPTRLRCSGMKFTAKFVSEKMKISQQLEKLDAQLDRHHFPDIFCANFESLG